MIKIFYKFNNKKALSLQHLDKIRKISLVTILLLRKNYRVIHNHVKNSY